MGNVPRPADLPPGADEENPYVGEDLDEYPDWWRENIEEFRKFSLRPYRPARFADGEVVPETIDRLEEQLGIDIHLYALDPTTDKHWTVAVDGNPVEQVPSERLGEGYTEFEIESAAFADLVRCAVDERSDE